jgi:hypothetical protein
MAGSRRRRTALLVGLAALFTAVVLLAEGSASSRPNANEAVQAYLDQVRPGAEQSAAQGADFGDVRAHAQALGRNGIDRRLDRLEGEVKTTLLSIETLSPPPSLRVAQAYLVAAFGVRLKAVTEARPAMDAALTKASSADAGVGNAVSELSTVAQDLGLGDRAFDLFLDALPPRSPMPANQPWLTDASQWTTVQLTAFVDRLRSSASATPVHDIAVLAFQTDPGVVSIAPDGTEVIPASSSTSVSMVLENVGNQPERGVNVYVYFTPDGAKSPTRFLRDFPDLAPGEMRSLTLRPLPTQPGMTGRLDITALPVPGETDTSNNTMSVRVMFK